MAVNTLWPVEHACGHEEDHDLSAKRPSERAGYGRWLAGKGCSACWRAERMRANSKERETWQAERRADEAAAIETWEHAAAMPPLDGSDKAIEWGRQVRYHLVAAAHDNAEASGQSDEDFNSDVETPAQMITSASWWIDQRDSAASDVAELVADVASDPSSDTGSENPF